jgi:hypothetical protein
MEPNTISVPPSQPVPQVQPQDLSVGTLLGPVSLFKTTWNFFKSNWKLLVPIIILPTACFALGQILSLFGGVALIPAVALFVIGIVLSVASQPAAVDAIHKLNNGSTTVKLVEQYKIGFKIFWPMLLLGVLQALISFGAAVLFVIPAVIVGIYLSMYLYTLVLDGKRGYGALTESYGLVYGRWFDVLGRILFVALVYVGFAIAFTIVSFVIVTIFGITSDSISEAVLSVIINLILSSVMGTLMAVYLYNMYLSLKATRTPNVDVTGFKKWLSAFTILGAVCLILLIVFLAIVSFAFMGGGLVEILK